MQWMLPAMQDICWLRSFCPNLDPHSCSWTLLVAEPHFEPVNDMYKHALQCRPAHFNVFLNICHAMAILLPPDSVFPQWARGSANSLPLACRSGVLLSHAQQMTSAVTLTVLIYPYCHLCIAAGLVDDAGGFRQLVLGVDDALLKRKVRNIPRADVAELVVQCLNIPTAINRWAGTVKARRLSCC